MHECPNCGCEFAEAVLSDSGATQAAVENKRMKDYLQYLYDGDGNIEFDELEVALRGKQS